MILSVLNQYLTIKMKAERSPEDVLNNLSARYLAMFFMPIGIFLLVANGLLLTFFHSYVVGLFAFSILMFLLGLHCLVWPPKNLTFGDLRKSRGPIKLYSNSPKLIKFFYLTAITFAFLYTIIYEL